MEFMKKIMDWALEKEDELAKNCAVKPEEIAKQIKLIEEKRAKFRERYKNEEAEFEHILCRLSTIKADSARCLEKRGK